MIQLLKKYNNALIDVNSLVTNQANCPFCRLTHGSKGFSRECKGCPMASVNGDIGCTEFQSFSMLESMIDAYDDNGDEVLGVIDAIKDRINFWENHARKIFENHPEEHFTKKGWIYFDDLDRNL